MDYLIPYIGMHNIIQRGEKMAATGLPSIYTTDGVQASSHEGRRQIKTARDASEANDVWKTALGGYP
jgi:hypothetical protein